MRRFERMQDAREYAELGGQSLHISGFVTKPDKRAPDGFVRTDTAANLLDMNDARLAETVRRLNSGMHGLTAMEWRPGWGIYFIPIGGHAMEQALERCYSRIVRRTVGI